jgi:P27 family predicted phage terminase small subunit
MDLGDECPPWVAEEGQAIWKDTLLELKSRDMLGRASRVQVATYCQTWAQYAAATAALTDDGKLAMSVSKYDKEGNVIGEELSPWYKVQQDAEAKLRRYWSDWRLLPKDVRVVPDDGHRRGAARLLESLQRSGKTDAAGSARAG